MEEVFQRVFKESTVSNFIAAAKSADSFSDYYQKEFEYPSELSTYSNLKVAAEVPQLESSVSADSDNAIKLHSFLKGLNNTQATDRRLWTYLAHVTFRNYTFERWGIKPYEELENNEKALQSARITIETRWLSTGGPRSLYRNSISRLWWAANITWSPWKQDPISYASLGAEDDYLYTKFLLSNSEILVAITERSLYGSRKLVFATLECLRTMPTLQHRDNIRPFMKEINLIFGYRRLEVLEFSEVYDVVRDAAEYCINMVSEMEPIGKA